MGWAWPGSRRIIPISKLIKLSTWMLQDSCSFYGKDHWSKTQKKKKNFGCWFIHNFRDDLTHVGESSTAGYKVNRVIFHFLFHLSSHNKNIYMISFTVPLVVKTMMMPPSYATIDGQYNFGGKSRTAGVPTLFHGFIHHHR